MKLDKIALHITIFLVTFLVVSFWAATIWLALLYALLSTVIFSIFSHIIMAHRGKGRMTLPQFIETSILKGNDYLLSIVSQLLNIKDCTILDNTLRYSSNHGEVMIINTIRFGNVSADEVVKSRRIALANNVTELYLIARLLDRKSIALANSFTDIKYIIISARRLYKMASKADLLPKANKSTRSSRPRLTALLSIVLSRNLAPRYLLTACILAFMTLFTPLKTYYIVLTCVTLLMALLAMCGISNNISPSKLGIFGKSSIKSTSDTTHPDENSSIDDGTSDDNTL